jgi:cellobiose phosphorylase
MRYGFFDYQNKEYVITRPDTPYPWINYLGSDEYCALISNTAGGYSFYKDPRERRILRYRYNNIPTDRGGRYLYIRDNITKEFWSATWQPILKPVVRRSPSVVRNDSRRACRQAGSTIHDPLSTSYEYECRHGLGYTIISSQYQKIKTKTTYFVPRKENLEVWHLEIENTDSKPRSLNIFSFVEFCLWDALNDMTDYQYNLNIGETSYENGTIFHLSRFRTDKSYFAFFSCTNQKVKSFDSQRNNFLGRYGSLDAPEAVINGECTNSIACGWSPVGSHCLEINLKAKEKKEIIFILGYSEDKNDLQKLIKKYKTSKSVLIELNILKKYWVENLNKYQVITPDEDVNLMVNIWNQYQCRTTFNWSRSASYFESGIGRGMGFRDSNQDTMGFVHQIPDKVRERIIDLASTQFEDGGAYHQYSPLTKKGNGWGFSDDHLWLIYAVASYLKESGDFAFLNLKVPFDSGKKAPMYDHMKKAVNYSWTHLGRHRLPIMGAADWNDCLTLDGKKGESVLVAMMLVAAAKEMINLAKIGKRYKDIKFYQEVSDVMTRRINKSSWTGKWYLRAFSQMGKPVGTPKDKYGKIYLEVQPWAVMSGVAQNSRADACLNSVKNLLATEEGVMILNPSYDGYDPNVGAVTIYPPGLKENGAIFCHPNPWMMVAESILGRGDLAFNYYKAILPAAKNDKADLRKTEPYVYCQMIAGREHQNFGEGKNSWLTGTAAWNFVAISQWILGIRPDYEGLRIDPCIPKNWDKFIVKRNFRGANYTIIISNKNKVNKGVKSIEVDSKKISGNIIPVFSDKKEHLVEVEMG